ncbi:MAG: MCP four helix bundle domain-containing protein, partial [Clostridiales bacterium]|nr:MCP four helix bundle domain-containing protein [Clostridiales bacterium]
MRISLKDMSVRSKLAILTVGLLLGLLIVGGNNFRSNQAIGNFTKEITDVRLTSILDTVEITRFVWEIRSQTLSIVVDPSPESVQPREARIQDLEGRINAAIQHAIATAKTDEEKQAIQEFERTWQAYNDGRRQVIASAKSGFL